MINTKLPKGWKIKPLGSFMGFKNGVNADKEAYGKGVKFVNVMDIFRKNCLYSHDVSGSVEITGKQLEDYSVIKGDVLFNRTSETPEEIAYSSIYLGDEKITFGGFVIRGRQFKQFLLPEYARYSFNTDTIRKEMIRRCQGVVRANIGQKDLSKVPIVIPPIEDQKRIACILDEWGNMIEKTETLVAAKERQLEWLCQKYFTPDNEITSSWPRHKIGNFVKQRKEKETPTEEAPLYSLTIEKGVTEKTDRYNREFLVKEKNSKTYKVVHPNDIVFNPANLRWGAIAKSEIPHKVVISPIYEVYKVLEDKIDRDYLKFALTCKRQIGVFSTKTEGTLIERMAVKADVFELCEIVVPPTEKQQKNVAKTLNTAKKEIEVLKRLVEKYREQKCGLMQKLLSGEWHIKSKEAA